MGHNINLILIFTFGFAFASVLGYLANRLKLPAILGFLIAGYLIGPFSPGFVADMQIAEQLAEIGVVLMLFGVGLHFRLSDLMNVKNIAVPGAVIQTLVATIAGALLFYSAGWTIQSGVIMGLAVGVASTVVLVRVLTDYRLLETKQGHIAVGWLVVEDLLTVLILILLPILGTFYKEGSISWADATWSIAIMLAKFLFLVVFMFTIGQKIVEYILTAVARVRSHELFTLTVLALVFVIAASSALVFGTSMALGAFIAGMVIGKTEVRHQAASNALPLKDTFAIIFFLTVGMLFNPAVAFESPGLFFGTLAIILLLKPLSALLIVLGFGYNAVVAITVAVALAQIGEFSFILAEQAMNYELLPDKGFDILVSCAIISISLNPILFRIFNESTQSRSVFWKKIRSFLPKAMLTTSLPEQHKGESKRIVVVGFGPVGQEVAHNLKAFGYTPYIIEQNIDTVTLRNEEKNYHFIFGDATQEHILSAAKIEDANLLAITMPDMATAKEIIQTARLVRPDIKIVAHVRFLSEKQTLEEFNVFTVCSEKEAAKAFVNYIHQFVHI